MALIVNIPTAGFAVVITDRTKGIYTETTGFMRIYKNGKRAAVPIRVQAGDYLSFDGNIGTIVKLR